MDKYQSILYIAKNMAYLERFSILNEKFKAFYDNLCHLREVFYFSSEVVTHFVNLRGVILCLWAYDVFEECSYPKPEAANEFQYILYAAPYKTALRIISVG